MENKFLTDIYVHMSRNKFKNEPSRLHVLIEKDLLKKYKKHCIDKDIVLSERIRELIEQDLKDNK